MLRLAITVLVPAALLAQPPQPRGPRPWWDKEVAKELNLTDAQKQQMTQIRQDFTPRMASMRDEVNKAEAAVDAAFNEDPVDQNKASEAISQLAAARGELTKAVSQMELKLRMTLTAQQWQQLNHRGRGQWPGAGPRRRRGATSTSTSGAK